MLLQWHCMLYNYCAIRSNLSMWILFCLWVILVMYSLIRIVKTHLCIYKILMLGWFGSILENISANYSVGTRWSNGSCFGGGTWLFAKHELLVPCLGMIRMLSLYVRFVLKEVRCILFIKLTSSFPFGNRLSQLSLFIKLSDCLFCIRFHLFYRIQIVHSIIDAFLTFDLFQTIVMWPSFVTDLHVFQTAARLSLINLDSYRSHINIILIVF